MNKAINLDAVISGKSIAGANRSIIDALRVQMNDPGRAGKFASRAALFGENSRFKLYAVHTRFDAVQWFVDDAERMDDVGYGVKMPAIVAQEDQPLRAVCKATMKAVNKAAAR